MIERIYLYIAATLLSCVGAYIWFRPNVIADKITYFYSRYPIIRYAGEKQMKARSGFVRLIGIVFFILGIICIFSV